MSETHKNRRWIFGIYCAVMIWLLFLQRSPRVVETDYLDTMRQNLNLLPGDTIRRFVAVWNTPVYHRAAIVNLVGNIIMFVPLGFGLPWAHPRLRRFFRTLLLSAGIILLVELVQLVTLLGRCDVDDLILNLIGALAGYGLYVLSHLSDVRSGE